MSETLCPQPAAKSTPARRLRVHLSANLGDGRRLIAVSTLISDSRTGRVTETEYGVMLSRYAARWRRTATTSEGRVHHEPYTVAIDRAGRATGCTCPDRLYRGSVCKHMAATTALVCRLVVAVPTAA